MIFNYTYVSYKNSEKLQRLIEHIVLEVWYGAKGKLFYMRRINSEFRPIVSRSSKSLKKPIHEIFKICSKFNQQQLDAMKEAFEINNKIEDLCMNKVKPVLYEELEKKTSKDFVNKIKKFFENLYSEVFNQSTFLLNEHYNEFFRTNTQMCPTCGLVPLEKTSDNQREDYDHYLPKSEYPFNAVNLYNLIPICKKCNQNWKKKKNPIRRNNKRTRAYYYYSNQSPKRDIQVKVQSIDPCNVDIQFTSVGMKRQVDTWNYLFNLSDRYKEYITHKHIGLGWHREIYNAMKTGDNAAVESVYRNIIKYAKDNPLDNFAFLKGPFLEECINKRLHVD